MERLSSLGLGQSQSQMAMQATANNAITTVAHSGPESTIITTMKTRDMIVRAT